MIILSLIIVYLIVLIIFHTFDTRVFNTHVLLIPLVASIGLLCYKPSIKGGSNKQIEEILNIQLEESIAKKSDDKDILSIIEKIARKKKKTISEIIYPPSQNIIKRYISGPYSLSEHISFKHKKHIYVFGEYHNGDICPKLDGYTQYINDFLIQVLKDHLYDSKTIDMFIEGGGYSRKNKKNDENIIIDTMDEKKQYLDREKVSPEYINLNLIRDMFLTSQNSNRYRFHEIDIRQFNNPTKIKKGEVNDIYEVNDIHKLFFDIGLVQSFALKYIRMSKNAANIIISLHKCKDYKKLMTCIINYIDNDNTLNKELSKIDDGLAKEIKSFLFNKINDVIKDKNNFNILYSGLSQLKLVLNGSNDLGNIYNYKQLFLELSGYLMDIYTLAKIMNKNNNHIIIYVGNMHAVNYREFLSQNNFLEIYNANGYNENKSSKEKANLNCLEITNLKIPLFSDFNDNIGIKSFDKS